jgi:murein DD-endopeptidase MepM/ murein hydrolase activator NlpD
VRNAYEAGISSSNIQRSPARSAAFTPLHHAILLARPSRTRLVLPVNFLLRLLPLALLYGSLQIPVHAQPFLLPTANHALFEKGGEERFFVGTVGKPWESGTFGCVRSEGWQMHEGLDIRCLQRDKHGEPTDPVMATADGVVAYINNRPSLSNYGNYIVVRHRIQGIEIYSLYAHLHEIRDGLKAGQPVKAGQQIAVMGRTANTHEGISKDRAHVHFELDLLVNDRFASWHKQNSPGQRNDHGCWNGQNLVGLDPRVLLLAQRAEGEKFSLLNFIRNQTVLFRVLIGRTDFPWIKRYPALLRGNPRAEKEGTGGYEIAFNFNGVPFELIPRAASELQGKSKYQLLSVNEAEHQKNPCRRLVNRNGNHWELGRHGLELLDLVTY